MNTNFMLAPPARKSTEPTPSHTQLTEANVAGSDKFRARSARVLFDEEHDAEIAHVTHNLGASHVEGNDAQQQLWKRQQLHGEAARHASGETIFETPRYAHDLIASKLTGPIYPSDMKWAR